MSFRRANNELQIGHLKVYVCGFTCVQSYSACSCMADKLTPFPEHSIPPDDGHGTAGWMGVTMVGLVSG